MIGVIGGTGMPTGQGPGEQVDTPFGPTSGSLRHGQVDGESIVILHRHGDGHTVPPHLINYRANLWALRQAGVDRIVSIGAVGNLRPDWSIGDAVICDQFVNRTFGREDTFFEGPEVRHAIVSDPYCPQLSKQVTASARAAGLVTRDGGVLLIIQGPRYSTRAENRDWRRSGYDVISMTHYPEVVLARELGLCFVSLCLLTDHASVLGDPRSQARSDGHQAVIDAFSGAADRVWTSIRDLAAQPSTRDQCDCRELGCE